eukprot:COSAG02_NODE_1008_length_15238_cov_24.345928_3_plen_70_part_00
MMRTTRYGVLTSGVDETAAMPRLYRERSRILVAQVCGESGTCRLRDLAHPHSTQMLSTILWVKLVIKKQ